MFNSSVYLKSIVQKIVYKNISIVYVFVCIKLKLGKNKYKLLGIHRVSFPNGGTD